MPRPDDEDAKRRVVIDFNGRRTLAIDVRRAILKRFGYNNVLVGCHVACTLSALRLPLPVCRVVGLGAKTTY